MHFLMLVINEENILQLIIFFNSHRMSASGKNKIPVTCAVSCGSILLLTQQTRDTVFHHIFK